MLPAITDPAFKTIYPNILNVDFSDPQFCGTCFYLIAVEAEESVRGSVVVTSSHSRLKFTGHKTLFDELSVGDSTLLERYPVQSGSMSMVVMAGSIAV